MAQERKNPLGSMKVSKLTESHLRALNDPKLDAMVEKNYGKFIDDAAAKYPNVPRDLIKRILIVESRGNPKAGSSVGAVGLMQLMPETGKRFGVDPKDRTDPKKSIMAGAQYLSILVKRYDGDIVKATAAYNAGEGNVDKGKAHSFRETRAYTGAITGHDFKTYKDAKEPVTQLAALPKAPPAQAPEKATAVAKAPAQATPPQAATPAPDTRDPVVASVFPAPTKQVLKPVQVDPTLTAEMPTYFGPNQQEITSSAALAASERDADRRASDIAFGDAFGAAVRSTHVIPSLMAFIDEKRQGIDNDWQRPTPEQMGKDLALAKVSPQYLPRLEEATSEEHYRAVIRNLEQEQEATRTLADAGALKGGGALLLGAASDPVNVLLNFTPVGWSRDAALAGEIGMNALRAKQFAQGAAIGAGVGVASEVPRVAMSETQQWDDAILGVLASITMGGGAGLLAGAPARAALSKAEFEALQAKKLARDAVERGDGGKPLHEVVPENILRRDLVLRPTYGVMPEPTREQALVGELLPPEPKLPPANQPLLERPVIDMPTAPDGTPQLARPALPAPEGAPRPGVAAGPDAGPVVPGAGPAATPNSTAEPILALASPEAPGRVEAVPGGVGSAPGAAPGLVPDMKPQGVSEPTLAPGADVAPGGRVEPTVSPNSDIPPVPFEPTLKPGSTPEPGRASVDAPAGGRVEPTLSPDGAGPIPADPRMEPTMGSTAEPKAAEGASAEAPPRPEPHFERPEPKPFTSKDEETVQSIIQQADARTRYKPGDTIQWFDKDGNTKTGTIEKKLDNGNYMVKEEANAEGVEKTSRVKPEDMPEEDTPDPFMEGSVGAAQADKASVYGLKDDIPDEVLESPKSKFANFRFDAAGRLKASENSIFRYIGNKLAADGVGINADGSKVAHTAEELADMTRTRSYASWLREANAGFKEFDAGNPIRGREARREQFMSDAALAYEQMVDPKNLHPGMVRAINATKKYFKDWETELKASGVKAAQGLGKGDKAYIPHVISNTKVREAIKRFGVGEVEETLYQSLLARGLQIADLEGGQVDEAMKVLFRHMAKGWLNGVMKRGASSHMVGLHGFQLDDRPTLRMLLQQADVGEERIKEMLDSVAKSDKFGPQRLKHRLDFQMGYERVAKKGTGAEGVIRMSDLFERNLDRLVPMYGRQVAGHAALARTANIKSLGDWEHLMAQARDPAINTLDPAETDKMLKLSQFMYDAITGNPLEDNLSDTFKVAGRRLRDINYLRAMGQVGWAQMAEMGRVIAQVGLVPLMKQFPAFGRILGMAKDGKLPNQLARELEAATGIGTMRMRSQVFQNMTDDLESMAGKTDKFLHRAKNAVSDVSLMNFFTTVQQRMAAAGMSQKIADMVRKGEFSDSFFQSNIRELKSYGLDLDEAKAIGEQMKLHAKFGSGGRLHELNLDKWDTKAANDFTLAIHRAARRLVQENDYGSSSPFLHKETGKFLFQFRSFMINAYTKQTLHGLAMHDIATAMSFLMTTTLGAVAYTVQRALNEPDSDKLAEDLTPTKVLLAGFNRSGYSSLIPMTIDTGIGLATGGTVGGLFSHARSTGLASGAIAGNPTVDLINNGFRAAAALPNAALRDDYEFSKADARAIAGILPFNNILGIKRGVNALTQDLPRESSKGNTDAYELLFNQ